MRTRSQTRNRNRRQQQQTLPVVVEPCNLEEQPIPEQSHSEGGGSELWRNYPCTTRVPEKLLFYRDQCDHFEIKIICFNWNVPNDVIKLMMFPYSLEGAAKTWYEKEPLNSILTWDDLVTKFVNQFFPPSKTTHLKNKISRFSQEFNESFSEAWEHFKGMLRSCPHHGFSELTQVDTFYNGLNENEQDSLNAAAGGNLLSKTTREALNIIENKSKVRYSRNKTNASRVNSKENVSKTDERIDKLADQLSTLVEIVSKKVVVPPAPVKAVEENYVTCGGAHAWYNCPATDNNQNVSATTGSNNQQAPLNRVSNQMDPRAWMKKANLTRSGVAYEGPSNPNKPSPKEVVERETEEITDEEQNDFQGSTAQIPPPVIPKPIPEPEIPKTLPKSTPIPEPEIPKTVPKANIPYPSRRDNQKNQEKASYQKEKIFQMFQDLRFDISFADALFLMPRFAPTIRDLLMNKEKLLELVKIPLNENCSAMLLKKLPEKLGDPGKFLIPCEFPGMEICHALADLGASINLMPLSIWKKLSLPELSPTRMTLELADRSITYPKGLAEDVIFENRSYLNWTFYEGEITLRVDNEAVTFNLDQTMKYSSTNDKSVNRIDIIDEICEEYAPELLGFPSDDFSSGNPTSTSEPFTSEFTLEEIDAYLYDKSISLESDHDDCVRGKTFMPRNWDKRICISLWNMLIRKKRKVTRVLANWFKKRSKRSSFNVLKSPYCAIAWKITDIKGIDPRFCTHKILMEDDCKPSVQSQRRVNPKIHEVIKKEVIKLLDAGMIYPISDSPWVSPIHCVPKKGGMTVVANEENELILTRLVTGWRVCIDYRKLNEATRKDHFPLVHGSNY
ncbi:reverse transcriptase domain-containing protein [Tanacetum coccineum]